MIVFAPPQRCQTTWGEAVLHLKCEAEDVLIKALRIVAGFALIFAAGSFFIEGGLSRFARIGIPPKTDWRMLTIGFILAGAGGYLLRPIKKWGRR